MPLDCLQRVDQDLVTFDGGDSLPVEVLADSKNEKDGRTTVGGDATQATESGVKAARDGPGDVEVPKAAPEGQLLVVPLA